MVEILPLLSLGTDLFIYLRFLLGHLVAAENRDDVCIIALLSTRWTL